MSRLRTIAGAGARFYLDVVVPFCITPIAVLTMVWYSIDTQHGKGEKNDHVAVRQLHEQQNLKNYACASNVCSTKFTTGKGNTT